MSLHDQIKIEYGGMSAEVDVGIADDIEMLWREDIPTWVSCQGRTMAITVYEPNRILECAGQERYIGFVGPRNEENATLAFNMLPWASELLINPSFSPRASFVRERFGEANAMQK